MNATTKGKVLIVDDEEDILRLLSRALSKSGFEALSTSSALEALVLIQDNPISLVITDIRMPGMDGLDLIKQMQEINPDIPIVVITGYGDFSTASSALGRGAFYFLNKPFNIKTVVDVVNKGMRLPSRAVATKKAIAHTSITMNFDIPMEMDVVAGVSYQVSRAACNLGYSKHCYSLCVPFIIDELLTKEISHGLERNFDGSAGMSVDMNSERIIIEFQSNEGIFTSESFPSPLEEINFEDEQLLGMMMVRHFSNELNFSEDGKLVKATIYNEP